jgi:hypothetical protein
MKCPAEVYAISPRAYHGIPELHYPFHDRTASCGRLCFYRKKINLMAFVERMLTSFRLGLLGP